jgi:hypothetical protein
MSIETWSFFLKIEEISNSDTFFLKLKEYRLKYHYFQICSTYYLFLVGTSHSWDVLELCYKRLEIVEELNKKQRKLRSVRGFFLYVSEILEKGGDKNIEVLETNFPPLFWKRVKDVLRQNKKGALTELLFGTSNSSIKKSKISLEELAQNLQTLQIQVNLLKDKVKYLESSYPPRQRIEIQDARPYVMESLEVLGGTKQPQKARNSGPIEFITN